MVPQAMDELRTAWLKLKSHVDELTSERQHYINFFEGADAAHVVTDRGGVIVEANGAAVDLFERRHFYLCGRPLASLVSPAERRNFRDRLSTLVDATSWQGAVQTPEGRREVEFSARPIRDRDAICWVLRPAG